MAKQTRFRRFRLRPKSRAHRQPPRALIPRERLRSKSSLALDRKDGSRAGPVRQIRKAGLVEELTRPYFKPGTGRVFKSPAGFLSEGPPSRSVSLERIREILRDPGRNARKNVCETRYQRQQVLFAKNIAGAIRKSPGKGGTYRKTEDSKVHCERSI